MNWKQYLKYPYSVLWVITIIAAALRFYQISKDSLWLDESYSVVMSSSSWADIWYYFPLDVHPPLFYFIEHIFIVSFQSVSEFTIRLFPALCGIATIPVFYLIGREALDENSGLLMAAMLAVSQFAIHYSREARMYAPMLLAVSVAFWFWLKYRDNLNTKYLIGFAIASAIGVWLQFFAVIPFLVMLLFLPRWLDRFEGLLVTGVLCLPLVQPAMVMAHHQLSLQVTGLQGIDLLNAVWWALTGFNYFGFLFLGVLFCVGMWLMWENKEEDSNV